MSRRNLSANAAIAVLSLIFFTWGALTSLNDVLIPHLKAVFEMNYARTMLIQFTFFSTYLVMSLPAGRLSAHVGYKPGMVIGLLIVWSVIAIGLFNSIMFPTLFTLGIEGLGPLTPKASSLLVMAIFGGAVIPQLQGVLADRIGVQLAWYALRGSRPALRLARMSVPG